jgi:hypothetical protein
MTGRGEAMPNGQPGPSFTTTLNFAWQVAAVVWTATTERIYINNAWADVAQTTGSRPTSLLGCVYGSNFGLNADLATYGLWSGTPSLADLQAIEAAMRAELVSSQVVQGAGWGGVLGRMSLGPQGNLASPASTGFAEPLGYRDLYRIRAEGPGFVAGTVKVLSVPSPRPVLLYDRVTRQFLRETMSDSSGAYRFDGLQLGRLYFVVALDEYGNPVIYDAAVKDLIEAGL